MPVLSLEIWSDIACPWCYIGKRRLEAALAQFPQRDSVVITWRSFELNPSAPRESEQGDYAERLARKYGSTVAEAEAMIARMVDTAKAEGLELDFNHIQPTNTFDAHRLLHLSRMHDVQSLLKERLFRAYFCEGKAISDKRTLLQLATEVGLAAGIVESMLESDRFASDVRADESAASELGINAVPCFVFAGEFGLAGAQPPEVLLRALDQAWAGSISSAQMHSDSPSQVPR
jgi:predicted DsbA family dithiol-disulfide isomerase